MGFEHINSVSITKKQIKSTYKRQHSAKFDFASATSSRPALYWCPNSLNPIHWLTPKHTSTVYYGPGTVFSTTGPLNLLCPTSSTSPSVLLFPRSLYSSVSTLKQIEEISSLLDLDSSCSSPNEFLLLRSIVQPLSPCLHITVPYSFHAPTTLLLYILQKSSMIFLNIRCNGNIQSCYYFYNCHSLLYRFWNLH